MSKNINAMDNSDEDTNGSFEFVDKITDSSDSDSKSKENKLQKQNKYMWEDILGSGQLLKRIIRTGEGTRPESRNICEIKYECKYNDKTIEKIDFLKVPVSDSELIQGLDLILPLMSTGEISEVRIGPRFAYGSKGLKDEKIEVPPDATLYYTIELISTYPEPDVETMDVETREEIGLRKKLRGNWWFAREDYSFAIQCYKRALEYLDYVEQDDTEQVTKTESDKLIDERINVYNNLSVAQLKMNSPDDALHSVEIVLKLQPNNVKALFRKGKALAEKRERKDAVKCLKKALEVDPQNKLIQTELQKLQNLLVQDAQNERQLYKKMFEPSKINEKLNRSSIKNSWHIVMFKVKLGIFIGSLVVAVFGVIIYKYYVD
ncbi:hypothetical protein PGB90_000422 [Kerria lacca]